MLESKLNNNCTKSAYIQIYFKNIEDDIHLLIVKIFGLDIGSGEIAQPLCFSKISLIGFHKPCILNLSALNNLEVAQKFVVVEPEIIMRSQRLYGVESKFSDQLKA